MVKFAEFEMEVLKDGGVGIPNMDRLALEVKVRGQDDMKKKIQVLYCICKFVCC